MSDVNNLGGKIQSELYTEHDYNAISRFVNMVLSDMDQLLSSRQLTELHNVLQKVINNYSISSDEKLYDEINYIELNNKLLNQFLEDKRLFGLTEETLRQYKQTISYVLKHVDKGVDCITADDIRDFFEYLMDVHKSNQTTIDNYRRNLNSFYNYCVVNGLLYKNPVVKIERVKSVRKVKLAFTEREIIYMRECISNLRDKAIFELLLSSGMRLNELATLDYKDLNMKECSVVVHGKGNKEREVYFNELAKVSIERYLNSRTDENPALFVTLQKDGKTEDGRKYGYGRLGKGGISGVLSKLGNRSGVDKVHCHRFRYSFATKLLRKGVSIEQIQQMLGHAEIATTQLYAVSDNDEIQYNHKRYVN